MKYLIIMFGLFVFQSSQAASIKYYVKETKGDSRFVVVNSELIEAIVYYEDDKELKVMCAKGRNYDFKVNSIEEADKIIIKVFDRSDKSLITLQES